VYWEDTHRDGRPDLEFKDTVPIGLSVDKVLNDNMYNANLRTYIKNTASAMKVQLRDVYGHDNGWIKHRHVLFNNQTGYVAYENNHKDNVPNLPSVTKCALVYKLTDEYDHWEIYGVDLPGRANTGSIPTKNMTRGAQIVDIKWANGQDGKNNSSVDYVLYGFDETCSITMAGYQKEIWISEWYLRSAKLYAMPKDIQEPQLLAVAPMASSKFEPGDKIVIALVFGEIISSTVGVSIKVDALSDKTFNCTGGVGTNVLYFKITVDKPRNGNLMPNDITINNRQNIKDMVN